MKKLFSILFFTITLTSISAEQKFPNLESAMTDITDYLEDFLPENTTMLSIQPDAFIGKFFPSIPPRLAAGITFSGTLIDVENISDSLETVSKDIVNALPEDFKTILNFSIPKKIFLPTAAASVRIGGIFLPFDIGLYGITTTENLIKDVSFEDYSMDASYTCLGADIRYAILEGGNILPKISVGGGYIFSKYSFGLSLEKTLFNTEYGIGRLNGDFDLSLTGHTIYVQAQASKKFLLFTPFAGLKAYGTVYNSDVNWKITTSGLYYNLYEDNGVSTSNDFDKIYYQFYCGCGFQLGFMQTTLNAAYNFSNNKLSASLGSYFKL